jgi:FixJ family two-component response regulator
VVFLTTDGAVAEQSDKLGAEAYLNKPVTVDRLLEVVGLFALPSVGALA